MSEFEELMRLREETGAGLIDCKKAIEYAKYHEGCTAIGVIKACALAAVTPTMTFEERVRYFSNK